LFLVAWSTLFFYFLWDHVRPRPYAMLRNYNEVMQKLEGVEKNVDYKVSHMTHNLLYRVNDIERQIRGLIECLDEMEEHTKRVVTLAEEMMEKKIEVEILSPAFQKKQKDAKEQRRIFKDMFIPNANENKKDIPQYRSDGDLCNDN
jgi:hypothetical protein